MAQFDTSLEETQDRPFDLEPELYEGDGKTPAWVWAVVAIVIVFGVVFAPFQLFWPYS